MTGSSLAPTASFSSPPKHPLPAERPVRGTARAFTLIEMLVVLIILAILAGLIVSLAGRVTQGGKFTSTKSAIASYDTMLSEYLASNGGEAPAWVRTKLTQTVTDPAVIDDPNADTIDSVNEYIFPLVDGRYQMRTIVGGDMNKFDRNLDPSQAAMALFFLHAASVSPDTDRMLKGIDAKFIQKRDVWAYGWLVSSSTGEPTGELVKRRLRIAVPTDAFGFPLRMVHPEFHGGWGTFFTPSASGSGVWQADGVGSNPLRPFLKVSPASGLAEKNFSRSYRPFNPDVVTSPLPVGDADEGSCLSGRPYFYSVGADGDPGTRSDNVYTTIPSFPRQNAAIN